MLIDRLDVLEVLQRVVRSVSNGAVAEEDLMQESRYPGQSQSWYLQSCRFHLQNFLSLGRSVDSAKRCQDRCSMEDESDEIDLWEEQQRPDDSLLASVCAQDMLELLWQRVTPSERVILKYLADGFGPREIAQKLHVSHQCVSKHRMKIAALAIELGISPPPRHSLPAG